jgi:signal peptidase I
MVLSLLIPGAGQFLLKRQMRGIIFMLLGFLTLLIFFLAMAQCLINIIYISASIYIILQSIAICDVSPRVRFRRTGDLLVNISIAGLVWFGCYLITNQLMTVTNNYFWPDTELRTLRYNYPKSSIIQFNDTVLIQRQQSYSRGNILVYNCPVPYIYDNNIGWNHTYTAINKVIGLPGEKIKVKDGVVFINSIELENQSKLTMIEYNIPDMQWTLNQDEYFIINANLRIRRSYVRLIAKTRKMSVININAINGRIVRIVSPFQRRKSL